MDEERDDQVRSALVKGLVLVAGIAVVIALGTVLTVKALGLGQDAATTPVGPDATQPPSQLPSSALPVPGESSSPTMTTSPSKSPKPGKGDIQLSITPVKAQPMQRVNLTGRYPGNDNVTLAVQRYEDGSWQSFGGVQATVRVGTFATYVQTGRTGENRFRVFDPSTGKGSNVVLVTIGG